MLNFSRFSNIGIEKSVYVGDLHSDLFSSQVVFGGWGWFKRILNYQKILIIKKYLITKFIKDS